MDGRGRRMEAALREPARHHVRWRIERLVKCAAASATAVVNNAIIDYPILSDVVMGVVPCRVCEAVAFWSPTNESATLERSPSAGVGPSRWPPPRD